MLRRYVLTGMLGCLLTVYMPGSSSRALGLTSQDASTQQTGDSGQKTDTGTQADTSPPDPLQASLEDLGLMAAANSDIARYSPAIQAILKHVCRNDQTPTKSELKIARIFLPDAGDAKQKDNSNANSHSGSSNNTNQSGGKKQGGSKPHNDVWARGAAKRKVAELQSALQSMPGINPRPTFAVSMLHSPLGSNIGCVNMTIRSKVATVFDVPGGKKSGVVEQRAKIIKHRLDVLRDNDPLFWTHLSKTTVNGEIVVAANNGYIITADREFAQVRGCTPDQLADILIASIRNTFDPSRPAPVDVIAYRGFKLPQGMTARDAGRRGTVWETLTPENQQRQAAYDDFRQGNEAFTHNDLTSAEDHFLNAIMKNPDYVIAYESLASVYLKEHKIDDARDQYEKALNRPNLAPKDKSELQELLTKVK